MRFHIPHEFEIPDEWWIASGIANFKVNVEGYRSTSPSPVMIRIEAIRPPRRNPGVIWFERERMEAILKGFVNGDYLPPIEVNETPDDKEFRYRVQNGFHRYHASVAVGFRMIPIEIKPFFDINEI